MPSQGISDNARPGNPIMMYPPPDSNAHMSMNTKILVSVVISIAVIVVSIIMICHHMPSVTSSSVSTRLAQGGWVVYYRQGCGYCTAQKQVLAWGNKQPHNYIECDMRGKQVGGLFPPPVPCNSPTITGFPFWLNTRTGETRAGLQSINALNTMA